MDHVVIFPVNYLFWKILNAQASSVSNTQYSGSSWLMFWSDGLSLKPGISNIVRGWHGYNKGTYCSVDPYLRLQPNTCECFALPGDHTLSAHVAVSLLFIDNDSVRVCGCAAGGREVGGCTIHVWNNAQSSRGLRHRPGRWFYQPS